MSVKLPEVIRWQRQWSGNDFVVWVIVRKVDDSWRSDPFPGDYMPRGECLHHPFGEWLKENSATEKASMPHLGYVGYISFTDGRHRFAWCRDHDIKAMPVTVESRSLAKIVRRLFGSTSRTCRIPARQRAT